LVVGFVTSVKTGNIEGEARGLVAHSAEYGHGRSVCLEEKKEDSTTPKPFL